MLSPSRPLQIPNRHQDFPTGPKLSRRFGGELWRRKTMAESNGCLQCVEHGTKRASLTIMMQPADGLRGQECLVGLLALSIRGSATNDRIKSQGFNSKLRSAVQDLRHFVDQLSSPNSPSPPMSCIAHADTLLRSAVAHLNDRLNILRGERDILGKATMCLQWFEECLHFSQFLSHMLRVFESSIGSISQCMRSFRSPLYSILLPQLQHLVSMTMPAIFFRFERLQHEIVVKAALIVFDQRFRMHRTDFCTPRPMFPVCCNASAALTSNNEPLRLALMQHGLSLLTGACKALAIEPTMMHKVILSICTSAAADALLTALVMHSVPVDAQGLSSLHRLLLSQKEALLAQTALLRRADYDMPLITQQGLKIAENGWLRVQACLSVLSGADMDSPGQALWTASELQTMRGMFSKQPQRQNQVAVDIDLQALLP